VRIHRAQTSEPAAEPSLAAEEVGDVDG